MNRCFGRFSLKVLLHKAIFPETCNATDDDSIVRQVAEYISRCNLSCNVVKSQKPSQLQSNCLRMQIYDLFSLEDLHNRLSGQKYPACMGDLFDKLRAKFENRT